MIGVFAILNSYAQGNLPPFSNPIILSMPRYSEFSSLASASRGAATAIGPKKFGEQSDS